MRVFAKHSLSLLFVLTIFGGLLHGMNHEGAAAAAAPGLDEDMSVKKLIIFYSGRSWQGAREFNRVCEYTITKLNESKRKKSFTIDDQAFTIKRGASTQYREIESRFTEDNVNDPVIFEAEVALLLDTIGKACEDQFTHIDIVTHCWGYKTVAAVSQAIKLSHRFAGRMGEIISDDELPPIGLVQRRSMSVPVLSGCSEVYDGYRPLVSTTLVRTCKRKLSVVTHARTYEKMMTHRPSMAPCSKLSPLCISNASLETDTSLEASGMLRRQSVAPEGEFRTRTIDRAVHLQQLRGKQLTLCMVGDIPISLCNCVIDLDVFVVQHIPKTVEAYTTRPEVPDEGLSHEPVDPQEKVSTGCCANCSDEDIEFAKTCAKVVAQVILTIVLILL